jgi:membrane protease YdiL (CAAX protease family)
MRRHGMKRVFWTGLWLAVCLGLALAAVSLVYVVLLHRAGALPVVAAHRRLALQGIAVVLLAAALPAGVLAFRLAARRGWLPGLRPPRPPRWGILQAAMLIIGFLLFQVIGLVLVRVIFGLLAGGLAALQQRLEHVPAVPAGPPGVVAQVVAGYLTAALWSVWYIRRLGPARLRDSGPGGIGWCPVEDRRSYAVATGCALLILILVIGLFYAVPPDPRAIANSQLEKIFGQPGWPLAILGILSVLIAPPVEEFIFRGGVLAALSSRFSPLWAGAITTCLFMAVHFPEKISYPPGFIDVGLMAAAAAWLRYRYGSIRPAILLHVLYNALGMLAPALLQYLA